ncbi:MAG: hypothetical protein RLZ86_1229 [Actinomycetota bacterium]
MKVVADPRILAASSRDSQMSGHSVGLVPTMGALHAGHLALIEQARSTCDQVVVSIFVNPTQFSETADFENYPSNVENDLVMCERAGVDVVYLPDTASMYPTGFSTTITVDHLTLAWEGADRPGHFDGVATVVTKLLVASRADRAFFGQKDFQQCAVIARLITDLDLPVEMIVCPTVRDEDGLALSSRNARLTPESRGRALAIPRSLVHVQQLFESGDHSSESLCRSCRAILLENDLDVHYFEIVDAGDLTPISRARAGAVAIVAASCDGVRLLDNHVLT